MNIKNLFSKIFFIIGYKKKVFAVLLFLFLILSFFETLSLALIAPYLTLLLQTNQNIETNSFINELINYFNFSDNLIISFGIFIILIFTFKFLFSILNIYITNRIAWNEIINIRIKILSSFENLDYRTYIKKNSSDYINLIHKLTASFVKFTFFPIIRISSDLVILFAILIYLISLNVYILITLLLIFIIFFAFYDLFFRKKLTRYGYEANTENKLIFKNVTEMFYGFKELKILNKLNFFAQKIINSTKIVAQKQIRLALISQSPRFFYEFLIVMLIILFILIYDVFYSEEIITLIPTLSVFILAALRIIPILSNLNMNLSLIRSGMVAVEALNDELNAISSIDRNLQNKNFKTTKFDSLIFDNVTFTYNNKIEILKNIDFEIKRGEMVGILGDSGSGKSTFVDIFLGLLKPSSGEIILNHDNKNKTISSNIIKNISCYLPQENFIFEDNIISNITLEKKLQEGEIQKVKDLIKKFDLDIDLAKNLGDRGSNLSGGQRQRVSIARAFYFNRQILIMDESTSALDDKIENEIITYLNRIKKEVTIIIISHRLSTFKFCDKIYKIENKKIKNVSNHINKND